MPIVPASHSNDIVTDVRYASIHDNLGPATMFMLTIGYGIETIQVPMNHEQGKGKHKLASSVLVHGGKMVQAGHDLGEMLLHVTMVVPGNVLNLVKHPLFSKCSVTFSNGLVLVEGTPAGCVTDSMPMLMCGWPMSLPFAAAPTNASSTVIMNLNMVDFVAGWVQTVVQMIIDLATAAMNIIEMMSGEVIEQAVDPYVGGIPNPFEIIRDAQPSIAAGLVRLVGRLFFDYRGAAGVAFSYNQGLLGSGSVEATWNERGGVDLVGSGNVQGPLGFNADGTAGWHYENGRAHTDSSGRINRFDRVVYGDPSEGASTESDSSEGLDWL